MMKLALFDLDHTLLPIDSDQSWGNFTLELGWVDAYRRLYPDTTSECYTWWSNRGQAWANNVGWRIDYQVATPGIGATVKAASIYKEERFSDHSPLIIQYQP